MPGASRLEGIIGAEDAQQPDQHGVQAEPAVSRPGDLEEGHGRGRLLSSPARCREERGKRSEGPAGSAPKRDRLHRAGATYKVGQNPGSSFILKPLTSSSKGANAARKMCVVLQRALGKGDAALSRCIPLALDLRRHRLPAEASAKAGSLSGSKTSGRFIAGQGASSAPRHPIGERSVPAPFEPMTRGVPAPEPSRAPRAACHARRGVGSCSPRLGTPPPLDPDRSFAGRTREAACFVHGNRRGSSLR